jgi:hypothetical protein
MPGSYDFGSDVRPLELLGHDAERVQRLPRGFLLGSLLRRPTTDPELGARDMRGADEPPVVRRALDLEHGVVHLLAGARERLLELRLVVDVARAGVLDLVAEGCDDGGLDRLEAVLEVERSERGLEQSRKDVSAAGDAVELLRRDPVGALQEPVTELELFCDRGAARTRDHVGANLRQPALRGLAEAVVDRAGDGQLQDAVTEELEALVRVRPLVCPRRVGEDLLEAARRQLGDQPTELAGRMSVGSIDAATAGAR